MSSYINQGGLWDNQRKVVPKDPDFTGSINVNGVELWLAGWVSTSTNPKSPAINLSVTAKGSAGMPAVGVAPTKSDAYDIPF